MCLRIDKSYRGKFRQIKSDVDEFSDVVPEVLLGGTLVRVHPLPNVGDIVV